MPRYHPHSCCHALNFNLFNCGTSGVPISQPHFLLPPSRIRLLLYERSVLWPYPTINKKNMNDSRNDFRRGAILIHVAMRLISFRLVVIHQVFQSINHISCFHPPGFACCFMNDQSSCRWINAIILFQRINVNEKWETLIADSLK